MDKKHMQGRLTAAERITRLSITDKLLATTESKKQQQWILRLHLARRIFDACHIALCRPSAELPGDNADALKGWIHAQEKNQFDALRESVLLQRDQRKHAMSMLDEWSQGLGLVIESIDALYVELALD
jgi:hypothetical protein